VDFQATTPIRLDGLFVEDCFREPWRYVSDDKDTPLLTFADTPRFRAPENAILTTFPETNVLGYYGVTTYLVRGARWEEDQDGRKVFAAEVVVGRTHRWIDYRPARGVLPHRPGDELPEDWPRRLRDGE
jgi:hypothetical protein